MSGLRIPTRFVSDSASAYDQVDWETRTCRILDPHGQLVFEMPDVEAPKDWSQLAVDVAAAKYFRKSGLPKKISSKGNEHSVRQLVYRVAHTIREQGEEQGYFADKSEAEKFEQELTHILLQQKGAFNSPVWFNCGLFQQYAISGSPGNFYWDDKKSAAVATPNAYEHPQCSACFIQSIQDDMGSIFDLVKQEAKVFKYGSGSGTNFSPIRGKQENIQGGGKSSGLLAFLEVFDRAAGATKSGGITRRAAKMVCLDVDHPEIRDFIRWKMKEEQKARALMEMGFSSGFEGEAYKTISGQNSNNSVRVTDGFMNAVAANAEWSTKARTTGEVVNTFKAKDLWREMAEAAWACADPGVQFDTTIQKWHTCPNTGFIRASNPCSEYMFVDDSACNLASLNLVKFLKEDNSFDLEGFLHTARILFVAQEILVSLSSYPTAKIAENSFKFRPLGLGYANLGALLMRQGIAYDSDEGRAWTGVLTALLTGQAYLTSMEMAQVLGPFQGYEQNKEPMLEVMKQHEQALSVILPHKVPDVLLRKAHELWAQVTKEGKKHGFRNAQATVIAPTGTIGLLMDCDTTGIEPEYSLVKFKKLAGGGYFKIINQSVPKALEVLGYSGEQIRDILLHILGRQKIDKAPHINKDSLIKRGLGEDDIHRINQRIPYSYDLNSAASASALTPATLLELELDSAELHKKGQSLLQALGYTNKEIREASVYVCGHMTAEGAPHLRPDHLAVFDCASPSGTGKRSIAPSAHVDIMAIAQPFISGAISKTVNLPKQARVEDIESIYWQAWEKGLKAIAVYRDGSKAAQPLGRGDENLIDASDEEPRAEENNLDALEIQLGHLAKEAPECAICGHHTIRSGTCFKCMNCGHTTSC